MYIIFDTETTGLPRDWKATMRDVNNWPRVIQLAWAVYDCRGNLLRQNCDLIIPDGWEVPTGKFWTDNGFTNEKNLAEGIPISMALIKFLGAANDCTAMVAHNLSYDYNVLGAEMIRVGKRLNPGVKLQKYCTKELSTDYCKLPGNGMSFKWPKLEELHHILFGKAFEGAHDAMNDVLATGKCFFGLVNLGLVPGVLTGAEMTNDTV